MNASISLKGAFRVTPDDDPSKTFDATDSATVTCQESFRVVKLEDKAEAAPARRAGRPAE